MWRFYFVAVAKSFQTRYEYINGIQVLSDGNIVVYGTDYADWQYRLTLYTSQVNFLDHLLSTTSQIDFRQETHPILGNP